MSIPKTPPVGEALRSVRAKSLHRRIVTVVGMFLVAAALSFAGSPAATAAPASMNHSVLAVSDDPVLNCNGHYPGFCVP